MFLFVINQYYIMSSKKKQTFAKRIGSKFSHKEKPDELLNNTMNELVDIVSTMKDVFHEFDEGYEQQLQTDQTSWEKLQRKLPSFLQSKNVQVEEHRKSRIKTNRKNLELLEDNLHKLDIVLNSASKDVELLGERYLDIVLPENSRTEEKIEELENYMSAMQTNISTALNDFNSQLQLIKSTMDNMAGQLSEQGVVLEGIDSKVDVLDTKLDKAQSLLKKISRQVTGNRVLMIVAFTAVASAVVVNLLK